MGYFRFFVTHTGLFTALYPTLCIKKIYKKPYKLLILKGKTFHGDSVKNESARAKKTKGEGAKGPPQPV